jgi:hypothetical protein
MAEYTDFKYQCKDKDNFVQLLGPFKIDRNFKKILVYV